MRQFQNQKTLEFHELTPEMFGRFFENREVTMFREVPAWEQQYNKLFIRLSGHFLAEHLPDDFFTYEEEDQMEFIVDHVWEPFEYHSAEDVFDLIDSLVFDVQKILEKGI